MSQGAGDELRDLLRTLDPLTRDALRRVLIHDQDDRDAISSRLMRYRDQNGEDLTDMIDFLTCIRTRAGRQFGVARRDRSGGPVGWAARSSRMGSRSSRLPLS
jgi:hypothetical protein